MWSYASHSAIQHFWFPSHLFPFFLTFKLCRAAVVSQSIHFFPRRSAVVENGVVILKKTACYLGSGDLTAEKWKKLRSWWKSSFKVLPSCLKWSVFNENLMKKKKRRYISLRWEKKSFPVLSCHGYVKNSIIYYSKQ